MDSFEEVEKAAAANEARESLARRQPRTGRANEVEAALMHYLASEEYHASTASSDAADGGEERSDSEESS